MGDSETTIVRFVNSPGSVVSQSTASASSRLARSRKKSLPRWMKGQYSIYYTTAARMTYIDTPAMTLRCFSKESFTRSWSLRVVLSMPFSAFISLLIIINSCLLALYKPNMPGDSINLALDGFSLAVTAVFTLELSLNFVAFGIWGKGGLRRDYWRWLDVIVVALGWAAMSPQLENLAASLRLIRLLRLLTAFPNMRHIVNAIFFAIPALSHAFAILFICVISFALLGMRIWMGAMGSGCAAFDTLTQEWVFPTTQVPCALPCDAFEGMLCVPTYGDACDPMPLYVTTSLDPMVQHLQMVNTSCRRSDTPDWGQTNFDNAGSALLNSFWMYTTEGWSSIYLSLWHTWGLRPLTTILFTLHVYIGVYLIMELALASVWNAYKRQIAEATTNQHVVRGIMSTLSTYLEPTASKMFTFSFKTHTVEETRSKANQCHAFPRGNTSITQCYVQMRLPGSRRRRQSRRRQSRRRQ
jgi:hypothetical protein